ncbi:MAG: isochorismate synthase [Actinomycetaceae bacterium]|nr:isochorismate synthase [Actinomycetaceae bacterium]
MPKIYTTSVPIEADIVDAFCALQKDFTDQFVYVRKGEPYAFFGLGRCIAVADLADIESEASEHSPYLFSFRRFDEGDPRPADPLFASFPRVGFMLPELVLFRNETGTFLQVNSLGPVYEGRIDRFARRAASAPTRTRSIPKITVQRDNYEDWAQTVESALGIIDSGRASKLVLSRRLDIHAEAPFSFKDVILGLLDGQPEGIVFAYRYGDVFFTGCTPELLVHSEGGEVTSMCLAGSAPLGDSSVTSEKNLREHAHVVDFVRGVIERNCYDVDIPASPDVLELPTIAHLHTPVRARLLEGRTSWGLAAQLYPTPALSGMPVGEAMMALRTIEPHNRGFFGGIAGVSDAHGNGEYCVTIRSGVFDGEAGYVYAGCGIVHGSSAADEYAETDLKFRTMLSAFDWSFADADGDGGAGASGEGAHE